MITIDWNGTIIRFVEIDGRRWVAAVDLSKALRYSFPNTLPSARNYEDRYFGGVRYFDIHAHRKMEVIPNQFGKSSRTWIYDFDGFEYALWPRYTRKSPKKAELYEVVVEILKGTKLIT